MLATEDEALLTSFDVLERKRKVVADLKAASASSSPTKAVPTGLDTASRRPEVTWLRRTEYISSEFGKSKKETNRTVQERDRTEGKLETKDDLISTIENSFQMEPLESLVHPINLKLSAVECIPIVPGFDAEASFTQCLFDADPSASVGLGDIAISPDADKHAILRAMSNPNNPNETFVWYYLRSKESPDPDTFVYVRDYDIQRNDKPSQMYVLIMDGSGQAKYIPVSTQFHLRKRRFKANEVPRNPHSLKISRRQN